MDPSLIWIPATLAAAGAQTARNAMQHQLTAVIGTLGATQVRFLYGMPFAVLFLVLLTALTSERVPRPTDSFLLGVLIGALAQIAATALMLSAMRLRSFSAVTAFTKTEPVQVAIFGIIILGDLLSFWTALAIVMSTAGVVLLSGASTKHAAAATLRPRAVIMGIAAGSLFALTAVAIRGAILALPEGSFLMRSTTALVWTMTVQTLILILWLAIFNRAALLESLRIWRASLLAGLMGTLASQFWFIGFATTTAANVRTLGLVEVLFAAVVSRRIFAQAISAREWTGYGFVAAGVCLLLYPAG